MKKDEQKIIDLFKTADRLSSKDIGERIHKKDPSGPIRDLVYFEYLVKNNDENETFSRTSKEYSEERRKSEKRPVDYTMIINKVFTGKFLEQYLGHDIINFIKCDDDQRYVYLNPLGERNEKAVKNTKYVFHVIESPIADKNRTIYELMAASEISEDKTTIYNKDTSKENPSPKFKDHPFRDLFYCGENSSKAHAYSFKASRLLKPKEGKRIIIKTGRNETKIETSEEDKVTVELMCNPQHSMCYADASGKRTYSQKVSPESLTDVKALMQIIDSYLEDSNEDIDVNTLDEEQCFSVISGRAKLEVSTSNQIAYFLGRDKSLLLKFLRNFLNVAGIDDDEKFDIVREKEDNIDLLFKSKKHVVVVENKIDSQINGVEKTPCEGGRCKSQLSKYYAYVEGKYRKVDSKSFFILAPEYNGITQKELNETYENGSEYTLKTYKELFDILENHDYRPYGMAPNDESKFLFEQFKKSIEYLTWSKGMQQKRTAYIRLKQRLKELDSKNQN